MTECWGLGRMDRPRKQTCFSDQGQEGFPANKCEHGMLCQERIVPFFRTVVYFLLPPQTTFQAVYSGVCLGKNGFCSQNRTKKGNVLQEEGNLKYMVSWPGPCGAPISTRTQENRKFAKVLHNLDDFKA